MNELGLTVERTIDASRERLWAILEDHAAYAAWGPWVVSTLVETGVPVPGGVGAVRSLKAKGRAPIVERVVAFDVPSHMAYEAVSGLPLDAYRADIMLTELDAGKTRIVWSSTFAPKIPFTGWLVKRVMRGVYDDVIARLARRAAAA